MSTTACATSSALPAIDAYLEGLLLARLAYAEEARHAADRLAAREDTVAGWLRTLEAGLRAEIARRDGRPAEALTLLSSANFETWHQWAVASPFVALARERFLLAELLHEAGRNDEALRWYASLEDAHDRIYVAPALLRRAEIEEGRGRAEAAADLRHRFADLWSGADLTLTAADRLLASPAGAANRRAASRGEARRPALRADHPPPSR